MNILVTGGAGFLGQHAAALLKTKGFNLTLLDSAAAPAHALKDVQYIQVDVRNAQAVRQAAVGKDAVVHAAAALPLWKVKDIYSTNVDGTKNVLEAAKQAGVKHLVYISSTAVYGIPRKHPIEEEDPLRGVGPYGETKIAAEALCRQYREGGMCITVLRPKTFLGTGRLGVFEMLFDWVHAGKKIPVIGTGKNKYQLLAVDDLVEAIYRFLKEPKPASNANFNIGARVFGTVEEDLKALFFFAQSGSVVFPTPAWLVKPVLRTLEMLRLSPLYQWVYETADKDSFVSIARLEKALGWSPQFSNAQALIRAYQWYAANYDEIKSCQPGLTHTAAWRQGILGSFKRWF